MDLLTHLLAADPGTPRLTVYNEAQGSRLDFSAQTLDNWAAKVGNFYKEELDLEAGDKVVIDLPVSWQAAVLAVGAIAAEVSYTLLGPADDAPVAGADRDDPGAGNSGVCFTSLEKFADYDAAGFTDIVVVTDDPFGRGVEESGGELPVGAIDFGPTVRFYGDHFPYPTAPLPALFPDAGASQRLLSTGWSNNADFDRTVLVPLAAGGSAVVVTGLVPAERLESIAQSEKVTARDER